MDVNSITADITVSSSEGNSQLVICKDSTGKGNTSTVYSSETTTNSASASGSPVYKSNKSYPIMMKYDGIKIPNVVGNVKITVEWGVTSPKNFVDRKLQVIAGTNTQEFDIKTSSKAADNAELTINLGEPDTIYIASTNEVYINKISIKSAD